MSVAVHCFTFIINRGQKPIREKSSNFRLMCQYFFRQQKRQKMYRIMHAEAISLPISVFILFIPSGI